MNNALIGFSGFVGSTLLRQATFQSLYRSTNIDQINEQSFDTIVCAGAPAQKWIANREPEADRLAINRLISHLKTVKCRQFILISTVDVIKNPLDVDEDSIVTPENLHPYGLHRLLLEQFVQNHFPDHLIIRLPGLVGPGLRKNVIYDFLNNNNLTQIDSRGVFQFYPMVNLWYDIAIALQAGIKLLHLTAEPISVSDIAKLAFGMEFEQTLSGTPARYNMRTRHAALFGTEKNYQYSCKETLQAIRSYAQSEPKNVGKA